MSVPRGCEPAVFSYDRTDAALVESAWAAATDRGVRGSARVHNDSPRRARQAASPNAAMLAQIAGQARVLLAR